MEPVNLLGARTRGELRRWLAECHATQRECWVVVRRGAPRDDVAFWYLDAVEEALCHGWIDGTTKRLAAGVTAQRLSPRRRNSRWSELNKARCRRLERLGLMTAAGRAALPEMSPAGFIPNPAIVAALRADPRVWANFLSFPPLYRRIRIDTIQIKRHQPACFALRLRKLIENTRNGVMYGAWDDYGRLDGFLD